MLDLDRYEAFYADHLWNLLPEVYRALDSDDPQKPGPLWELVNRLGKQAAIVRRSIDRTLEDQSIESCDDWLIPYIGDLLATNVVSGLEARGQRLDVAKTIYYRRRKGTVGILEQIAADITTWDARVIEFFRRLSRTRHNFDPAIGVDLNDAIAQGLVGPVSHTAAGGFADLRSFDAALRTQTAFDEFAHYADFRFGRDGSGWHSIPKLGIFLWRLRAFKHNVVTPVPYSACPGVFTFDPTGREVPLFAAPHPLDPDAPWVAREDWTMPGKIDSALLLREGTNLYPNSIQIFDSAGQTIPLDLSPPQPVHPTQPPKPLPIDPTLGRFEMAVAGPFTTSFYNGFSSEIGAGPYDRRALQVAELSSPGAEASVSGGNAALAAPLAALGGSGTIVISDSLTYTSVSDLVGVSSVCVRGALTQIPAIRLDGGEWAIHGAGGSLSIEGVLFSGADIVLEGTFETVTISCCTLDPGEEVSGDGTMPTSADGRRLVPTTLWIEGSVDNLVINRSICGPIRTRTPGVVGKTTITDSIVQGVRIFPIDDAAPPAIFDEHRLVDRLNKEQSPLIQLVLSRLPTALRTGIANFNIEKDDPTQFAIDLANALEAIIAGPAIYSPVIFGSITLPDGLADAAAANPTGKDLAVVNAKLLECAFPYELGVAAIALLNGEVSIDRTTVMGRINAHVISASESILDGLAVAENPQEGCIRFSAYVAQSDLHHPYESLQIEETASLFVSRRFAQPEYAQLTSGADREIIDSQQNDSIISGAQNGSEMGAFCIEIYPIKERALRIKFDEYMPVGLTPIFVYVT